MPFVGVASPQRGAALSHMDMRHGAETPAKPRARCRQAGRSSRVCRLHRPCQCVIYRVVKAERAEGPERLKNQFLEKPGINRLFFHPPL